MLGLLNGINFWVFVVGVVIGIKGLYKSATDISLGAKYINNLQDAKDRYGWENETDEILSRAIRTVLIRDIFKFVLSIAFIVLIIFIYL